MQVSDSYYQDSTFTVGGADIVRYEIPLTAIDGTPATVRVRLRYQTIPPYYLIARFQDGAMNGSYGPETQRLIYFTSRLNLDLGLKSTKGLISDPANFDVMQNWTMVVNQAERAVSRSP